MREGGGRESSEGNGNSEIVGGEGAAITTIAPQVHDFILVRYSPMGASNSELLLRARQVSAPTSLHPGEAGTHQMVQSIWFKFVDVCIKISTLRNQDNPA